MWVAVKATAAAAAAATHYFSLFAIVFILGTSIHPSLVSSTCIDDGYALYVWTNGFNASATHCNGVYPVNKAGENATCFRQNWDSTPARERLVSLI